MHGTLALLWRSVRADAVGRRPHAFRIGSVLLILVLLLVSHTSTATSGMPGLVFFQHVSYLMTALITLAGVGYFATSITEEKEDGTLGLLLMADLSPLSILLGKSTSRVFSSLLVFAAQIPFALLALSIGGVTVWQILTTYAALSAYLFLMANVALLLSVISRRTGFAQAGMIALTILLHGFAPVFHETIFDLQRAGRIATGSWTSQFSERVLKFHEETSVVFAIQSILRVDSHPSLITWQIFLSLLGGGLAFFLAWAIFRQIVWATDLSAPPRPLTTRRARLNGLFTRRPWKTAFVWKDYYFLAGGTLLLLLKVVFYPLMVGAIFWGADWVKDATGWTPIEGAYHVMLTILGIELIAYSSQLFHLEQKWGTLPTLMMLPKSAGRIAYGKVLGCLLASLPTFLTLLAIAVFDPYQPQKLFEAVREPLVVAGFCAFVVLCQLTVLCSLIARWGALPLAAAIMIVLGFVVAPFLSAAMIIISGSYRGDASNLQFAPILYATGVLSAVIQLEIGRRIHIVAGS